MSRRTSRLWLPGALALATSCGPIQSTAYLLDAAVQIEGARTAQAEKYAPYEWTSANLYLHKAREEVGYSDFEQAVEYSKKAATYAKGARDQAMKQVARDDPSTEAPAVVPVTPGVGN